MISPPSLKEGIPMKENKRPWIKLFDAVLWGGLFWMKLHTYTDYLLPIHNEVFSPEEWQKLQGEHIVIFLMYGTLVLLSLLRFFLYNRKVLLLWAEAVLYTLCCVCGIAGLLLLPVFTDKWFYLLVAVLLAVCVWSWYDLWKHYRTPV